MVGRRDLGHCRNVSARAATVPRRNQGSSPQMMGVISWWDKAVTLSEPNAPSTSVVLNCSSAQLTSYQHQEMLYYAHSWVWYLSWKYVRFVVSYCFSFAAFLWSQMPQRKYLHGSSEAAPHSKSMLQNSISITALAPNKTFSLPPMQGGVFLL